MVPKEDHDDQGSDQGWEWDSHAYMLRRYANTKGEQHLGFQRGPPPQY